MSEFVTVAKVGAVPEGEGRTFQVGQRLVAVFNRGGTHTAIDDVCPHMGASLGAGHLDEDGRVFVDGREDDMIVSGGENVYPGEVEDLLAALPQVREAAVIGVPDDEYGQRLAAYLVLRDGEKLDAEAVRDHVRRHRARFSVPRDVVFLDALPRNATGKVLARELRAGSPG